MQLIIAGFQTRIGGRNQCVLCKINLSKDRKEVLPMKEKYIKLLRNSNYLKLFIADSISRFGDSIDSIVMTMLVYTLTQSASWSAFIFAMNRIPTIFIQPLAGTYIEKKNKKKIMVMSDVLRAGLVGVIATELIFGILNQWHLLIITFLISTVEAFRQPASMSIIPQILDQEELDVGLSLSSGSSKVLELAGYGLAGVLITCFGSHIVIYIDMITFICSSLLIALMSVPQITVDNEKKADFFQEFKDGFSIIVKYPQLKTLVFLAIYLNVIFTPFNALQAPFVEEVLHSSSAMLSIISMSLTLGMIIGSFVYPILKEKINIKTMIILDAQFISITYIGVCLAGYYIQNQLILDLCVTGMFFLTGFGVACLNMFANTELLKITPENYLSRVSALMTSSCVCMVPITSFMLSLLTSYWTTAFIFVFVGMLNMIIFTLCFQNRLSIFTKTVNKSLIQ